MVRDAYTFLIPLGILGAICLLLGWMFVLPLLIIGGILFFLAAFVTVENRYAKVMFKQIAGGIARRIVLWKKVGDEVRLGERVGLIKFGSRADIIPPPQVTVMVRKGQRVKGGITIIGKVSE